eukprot:scaffold78004_cov60-Phaeocystis_antarctica.AAC.5
MHRVSRAVYLSTYLYLYTSCAPSRRAATPPPAPRIGSPATAAAWPSRAPPSQPRARRRAVARSSSSPGPGPPGGGAGPPGGRTGSSPWPGSGALAGTAELSTAHATRPAARGKTRLPRGPAALAPASGSPTCRHRSARC